MSDEYILKLVNDELDDPLELVEFCSLNIGKDIVITVNQESTCLTHTRVYDYLDLFKFASVRIRTANPFEQHTKYKIIPSMRFCHWFDIDKFKNSFDFNYDYSWDGQYKFGCFYGRPSAQRLGVLGHLITSNPQDSLLKIRFNKELDLHRMQYEIGKLFVWDKDCMPKINALISQLDDLQSDAHAYNYTTWDYDYGNRLNYYYKHILIDIVSEANIFGTTFYPTEKIVRAMLCRRPFLVLAPKHYLKYLKKMGFQTFNQFWPEDYDDHDGPTRYFEVIKMIDFISSKNAEQLKDMQEKMQDIVDHNYNMLVNQKFKTWVRKISQ